MRSHANRLAWGRLLGALVVMLLLAGSKPAFAQSAWGGAYAGADFGIGFKTLDFSVEDGWFQPSIFTGSVNPRVNVGGHAGFDYQIKRLVLGGEGGFSYLGYQGELIYGAGTDTKATSKGGPAWSAMGRIGWIYRQAMPYFEAGVLGSRNMAAIADDCQKSPCGPETGHGSGSTTATRWAVAYGVQFASTRKLAGRGWALRIDWLQVDSKAIENVFERDVTGPTVPGSITVTNTIRTPLSNTLRIMFDIKLARK